MSDMLKKLGGDNTMTTCLFALVIIYGLVMLFKYFDSKSKTSESLSVKAETTPHESKAPTIEKDLSSTETIDGVRPTEAPGDDMYASVAGGSQAPITNTQLSDPSKLLPVDGNSQWSKTTPLGQGKLMNVGLLEAGKHIGINTVGSTMKNANQQLRSDPVISRSGDTGIWNQSSYEPDLMRPTLEIGGISASS